MGNSTSHPNFLALDELLRSKDLKVKRSTIETFLEECDTVAPWFSVSESLMLSSWDKLRRDIDFTAKQGTLKGGVKPIWKLIRGCLEGTEAVENRQAALEMLQEEWSERAHSERGSAKGKGIYPSLEYTSRSEEGSESEEEQLMAAELRKMRLKEKKADSKGRPPKGTGLPSAPPPYNDSGSTDGGASRCPHVWRQIQADLPVAFPVFTDPQGQRYYEPLDFKTVKALAEAVRTYWVSASFTISLVETLTRLCITPTDRMNMARACLNPGQYLEWKSVL